eukprot:gene2203-2717_t
MAFILNLFSSPAQILESANGRITFKVSDVKEEPVNVVGRQFEFKNLIPRKDDLGGLRAVKTNTEGEKPEKERTIVASSPNIPKESATVAEFGRNSFILSAVEAYNRHHHWVVKPDDVWMAIIVQFSNYVNANSEKLRTKFVDFEGKRTLKVNSNGTLFTAPYDQMALSMTDQIAKNIKDETVRTWALPDFTTTNFTDKVVGAVALMATMKQYFNYEFHLLCGLPRVTLLGTVEDWNNIKARVQRLLEFGIEGDNKMKKWVDLLSPIIDQFIQTASGKPDATWWNKIVNNISGGSGPSYITGWITAFCVFNDKGEWIGDNNSVQTMSRGHKTEWIFVDNSSIPTGYVSVPIKINDNGVEYQTEMYAGAMAANIPSDSPSTIKPQLDWCLFLVDEEEDKKQ